MKLNCKILVSYYVFYITTSQNVALSFQINWLGIYKKYIQCIYSLPKKLKLERNYKLHSITLNIFNSYISDHKLISL